MLKKTYKILLIDSFLENYHQLREILSHSQACRFTLEWVRDFPELITVQFYDAYLVNSNVNNYQNWAKKIPDVPGVLITDQVETGIKGLDDGFRDYLIFSEITPVLIERSLRLSIAQESGEFWKNLVELLPVDILRVDLQRNIIYFNKKAREITGLNYYKNNKSRNIQQYINEDDRENIDQQWQQSVASKSKFSAEYRWQYPNGKIAWVRENSLPEIDKEGNVISYLVNLINITQCKKLEKALEESEKLYASLAESVPVGLYRNNPQGNCIYINQKCTEILDITVEECSGIGWLNRVHPDDQERVWQSWYQCFLEELPWSLEYRFVQRNGKVVWVYGQTVFVSNSEGERIGSVGSLTDITDIKAAETKLQESESKFRQLAEYINEVFFITTPGSQEILYISPAYEKIWGLSCQSIYDNPLNWLDLIHPEDLANVVEKLTLEKEGIYTNKNYRILRNDGQVRWLSERCFPVKNSEGTIERVVGFVQDITEQTLAELNLKYRLQLETALAEVSRQLATNKIIDLNEILGILGKTVKASRAFLILFREQVTRADKVNEWTDEFSSSTIAHSQNVDMLKHGWWRSKLLKNEPIIISNIEELPPEAQAEKEKLQAAGVNSVISIPIVSHGGEIWGVIGFDASNSNRKKWLEEDTQLLRVAGDIIYNYTERLKTQKALEEAKEAAEAASVAKSEFLAQASHELRTSLNAILGYSKLLSYAANLNSQQQEYLRIINSSGEHLLSLINDFLDLAKIEANQLKLKEETFDFYYFLDSLQGIFQMQAEAKNLELVFTRKVNVPQYVKTDRDKLYSVLSNLLGNALKFTLQGRVELKVTTNPQSLAEVELIFIVKDTGIGIRPEEINNLFEAFVQSESSQDYGKGTGLGLAISKNFVNLMGGEIRVESELGVGSTFIFNIICELGKVSQSTAVLSHGAVTGVQPDQPQYRLLIVDDIDYNRQLLAGYLQPLGFEIQVAKDGEEGLKLWQHWHPHLIFMDLIMPLMDGYQVIQAIRAQEQDNASGSVVKIIVVTASILEQDQDKIKLMGIDDFLFKPIQIDELWQKLALHLGIQYVYETPKNLKLVADSPESFSLEYEDLLQMSSEWRSQVYDAALAARHKKLLALIAEIPPENKRLIAALNFQVKQLNFSEIIKSLANKQ